MTYTQNIGKIFQQNRELSQELTNELEFAKYMTTQMKRQFTEQEKIFTEIQQSVNIYNI